MKGLIFVLGLFFLVNLDSSAQDNAEKVVEILKPNSGLLYTANDSTEVIIRIKNDGPNDLIAGDQFKVTYSLTNASGNGVDFDTLIQVGSPTLVAGNTRTYTINNNLKFDGDNTYSLCADVVRGTTLYPNNTNKMSSKCETFLVNLEKVEINIGKLYYTDNMLHFTVNSANNKAEVYDITGKLIVSKKLKNNAAQSLRLNLPAKGFYFLKVTDGSGNSKTSKFVIN